MKSTKTKILECVKDIFITSKSIFHQYFDKEENIDELPYKDLTPIENVDNKEYEKALDWAFQNKNICNIALTGVYGAGKSSILRTYEYNNKRHKYLNISLAAFDIEENNDGDNTEKEKISKKYQPCSVKEVLIERGILRQLFYTISKKNIPNTRFRKIEKESLRNNIKNIGLFILIILGLLLMFIPNIIENIVENLGNNLIYINTSLSSVITGVLLFILGGIGYMLYQLYNTCLFNKQIKKVSLNTGSIELEKNDNESAFDKYLDIMVS